MSSATGHGSVGTSGTTGSTGGSGTTTEGGMVCSEWTKLVGSEGPDAFTTVTVDGAGNIIAGGYASGSLRGQAWEGLGDAVVAKYDAEGNEQWVVQFGGSQADGVAGVTTDAAGNVYALGNTVSPVLNGMPAGARVFVVKYDATGNLQWMTFLGTSDPGWAGYGITAGPTGDLFVVGSAGTAFDGEPFVGGSSDAMLMKLDNAGGKQWSRSLGTTGTDYGAGIVLDDGGAVYVAGTVAGSVGGQVFGGASDAFVAKYNIDGTQSWVRLIGGEDAEEAAGVTVGQDGDVYVAGRTWGSFPGRTSAGLVDIFVAAVGAAGEPAWTLQVGSAQDDAAGGIAAAAGALVLVGTVWGPVNGQMDWGGKDILVWTLSESGVENGTFLFGTSAIDDGYAVSIGNGGGVYVAGRSFGDFQMEPNTGHHDAVLMSLCDP